MPDTSSLTLGLWDYVAFAAFFVVLSIIGFVAGRKERGSSQEYFLAGRKLPWYVVGCSFIASNISSEHFIGMIGASFIYGVCICMFSWANIGAYTFLIWLFIPFLLASRVFTIPEFLEKRFNRGMRQFFAIVTVISNVVAFLAAVLYGGALALQSLFGWSFWPAIIALAIVAGAWAIYGGLSSVAWTDFFTVIVMLLGGLAVTLFGLNMLGGEEGSIIDGFRIMLQRNQAVDGAWATSVSQVAEQIKHVGTYNRMSVFQSAAHPVVPWPSWIFIILSVSIWYNVLNQFMIQRVLGAKNAYHARMGVVLAGFMQLFLPLIIVVPGMILFASQPDILMLPWAEVKPTADKAYVDMIQALVPVGLRGLVLAALFGAIQSTVNSVLNSTATIVTLDLYKTWVKPDASDRQTVRVGVWTSVAILIIATALGGMIGKLGGGLFEYIQSLYAFFAPPFSAVFLVAILWRRVNGFGASLAVTLGFVLGIAMKAFIQFVPSHPVWIEPFLNQAAINWAFCTVVCIVASLATKPPRPEQVTDALVFNPKKARSGQAEGGPWYTSVLFWWLLFAGLAATVILTFSGVITW
ncbi:MAG: sodium/solute symporter [Verrucomicrobia bacterium]|jgi:solute:Na+ symporter, SSS family|nr:sodium/solute symporter [Verrucomicrobiota bacterium]MBT7065797.1 sodium/solute symporter [Verrucomicrobiota bacterium]MBT7701302.1 sodium/solute symporter [Verrucomicrobiota bacterium]